MSLHQKLTNRALALCALLIVATACTRIEAPVSEGALVVAAFPEPAAVHMPDGSVTRGVAYDYLDGFANRLGVPLKFITVESFEELELLVREGHVHIGAFINTTPAPKGIIFSKSMASMPLWVVQHNASIGLRSIHDLAGKEVHVAYGSPAAAALNAMPPEQQPKIFEVRDTTQQDLLRMVATRQIELVAVDEINMRVAANFQPDLQPAIKLFGKREIAFAFPENMDRSLHDQIDAYIDDTLADGTLQRLYDSYYGHIQRINPALADAFLTDIKTTLPKLRAHFHRAQERTGLDWRLIAALAYQESKWDSTATSYTSVRGIMMLTEDTADLLKVDNRLDPGQSIRGGADYLLYLMDQLPDSVVLPDRLWMALAAYNLGMGHLNGARAIAKSLDKDPDVWIDLKAVLPLLMRPEYYERLKSGRARGGEAVILVENVRNLFGVLTRLEPAYIAPLSGQDVNIGKRAVQKVQPSKTPAKVPAMPARTTSGKGVPDPLGAGLRPPGHAPLPGLNRSNPPT